MLKLYEFCRKYDVNVEICNIHGTVTIKFSDDKTNRRFSMCFDDYQIEKLTNKDAHENRIFELAIDMLGLEEIK